MVTGRSHTEVTENMKQKVFSILIFFVSSLFIGCNSEPDELAETQQEGSSHKYVVLDESLRQLKEDFNSNQGTVRLLFIVGDTCGICLRGMADLNDKFIALAQTDRRLLTLVVHVPTMGAREEHVAPAIPLLDGPRVLHYWDGNGRSGVHVGTSLKIDGIYAWDVWLAYGPDAVWLDEAPPSPGFWMHQLSPFDKELRLDAKVFGEKTLKLMETVNTGPLATIDASESDLMADGTEIGWVGQPLSVPVKQHLRGIGGYQNPSRIKSITHSGLVESSKGNISVVQTQSVESGLRRNYEGAKSPLPSEMEVALAEAWELNGPLFEWKDKGHQLRLAGMLKIGASLSWKVYVRSADGKRKAVYIDSHNGDIVLINYFNDTGELLFSVRASDIREVQGIRVAFRQEYLDPHGQVITEEEFEEVIIQFK